MSRPLLTHTLGLLAACLVTATLARADEVTDWNQTLFRSAIIAGTSPLNTTRVNALVQAAVFDAVNGIDRRYTPIHVAPNAVPGASRRAAAVQAAYVMLGKHYGVGGIFTTNQQAVLDARRNVSLIVIAADDSSTSIADGVAWGQYVADQIWAWRLGDGFNTNPPIFAGGTAIGQWRPRAPNAPATGIGCFTNKYSYTFWRPITAIREDDGNPATVQDPTWTPLLATPGHPDYPSGHSCLSGAAGVVLGREFGNHIPFTVDSDAMLGVTRQFHGVKEVLEEIRNARILAGIHFGRPLKTA